MPDLKKDIATKTFILFCATVLVFLLIQSCHQEGITKQISFKVHEGTELGFDLSPDGQTIVFDLLGQIWLLPVDGGESVAMTDSVKENTEYLHPTFSSDGKRIVFWESRPESWGLSSMNLSGEERRILTKADSDSDIFHSCSPINSDIVFIREQKLIVVNEEDVSISKELPLEGLPRAGITDPMWSPDGKRIAFINARANRFAHNSGRLWHVGSKGGTAQPLTPERSAVRAPAYSPDGKYISYFLRNMGTFELWIQDLDTNNGHKLTAHDDITPLRIRWLPDGNEIIYCAAGRIWRISVEGGVPKEIPFTAQINFSQNQANLNPTRFPKAGEIRRAKGHMGFVISPDGRKIAAIAVGKLWVWRVTEKPDVVAELPLSASCLCWSPNNNEVVWSAGIAGFEDLFATNVETALTHRLTFLPGTETKASWSPDGRYIAFMHLEDDQSGILRQNRNTALRIFEVDKAPVSDLAETHELYIYPGPGRITTLSPGLLNSGILWGSNSRWLLAGNMGTPVVLSIDGKIRELTNSRNLPADQQAIFWGQDGSLLYERNYKLWRIPFDPEIGISGDATPISADPALYPSTARDGSILYFSRDGWLLRRPNGDVKNLGWPISFKTPDPPESILIRNVGLIDGTGHELVLSRDIQIEGGHIVRIAPTGKIEAGKKSIEIEGEGRIVIPGLIDSHVHFWDQVLMPEYLFEGITAMRDMGSELAWVKGYQEFVEAGIQAGPRILVGGIQLGPSLVPSSNQRGNPYDREGYERVMSLAEAFDLDFIKMYWPRNSYSGAKFIEMAHVRGFPVSSHFGYPLHLAAAGIDSKEHLNGLMGSTGPRFGGTLYDDIVQLSKASGIWLVPTIDMSYRYFAAMNDESVIQEAKSSPFLNDRLTSYMPRPLPPAGTQRADSNTIVGLDNVARFFKAEAPLAAGTDYPFYWTPWMLHRELERYVQAGMSPLEAIVSATRNAAKVLNVDKDIGTIEEGKLADLLILDANPLENIRNTRKIWKVIQGGKLVDRDKLKNWQQSEKELVEKIGKEQ